MDCKATRNKSRCNCSYEPCPRKGICCDCLEYHRQSGELPACYFPDDVERSWDRSADRFVKTYKERGFCWK